MARYSSVPREGHRMAMFRLFGYLKYSTKRHISYTGEYPEEEEPEVVKHN
jgi:uncharacterized protein YaeQ